MKLELRRFAVLLTSVLFCLALAEVMPLQAEEPAGVEFFEKQVRPLLVNRCYQCHSGTKAGGGLSLETAAGWKKGGDSGPALMPGKPEESLLIEAIHYRTLEMPPRDAGGPLTKEEIATLTKWVTLGAPDPRVAAAQLGGMTAEQAATWWAFQPLPEVPGPPRSGVIDALLESKQKEYGLESSPPADRRTLIRRATYDLTGLPPTPEEVENFLADDSRDAFAKVVDRLLASPQYGVKWGRNWLDVVRYADTAGENTDRPLPHAWRYRNWVIDALNRDLPFDEFARLQLAGDLLRADASPEQRAEGIVATGYLAIARRFGHDIDKDMHLTHEDLIDNLGKNFLGLTLGCARCHDHKYDPVTSADYYALAGIFSSTKFSFPGCEPQGQPRDLMPLIPPAQLDALTGEYQARLQEYEARAEFAARQSERLRNLSAQFTRALTSGSVGEGKAVPLGEQNGSELERITLRKGELLQLTVQRNGNHGADTTRVEWEIARLGDAVRWNIADVIPAFTAGGPLVTANAATWCFLDVTKGPVFLREKKLNIQGQPGLHAWASGDTPSVVVNAAKEPVDVWTKLPAESVFVHPGPAEDVAVAWVCPADGEYRVTGLVADAHPAPGLDGISFRLDHIAEPEIGRGLLELGRQAAAEKPAPPVYPVAYAVREAEPKHIRLHLRGDPEQPGDEIPRRWLSVFGGSPVTTGSGRRELADWVTGHPLLARVMVNRVWQGHFGRGLVATPNDFGSRGAAPSHPELLEWLAAHFRANGYRLKPLHRLILLTEAYQRSGETTPVQAERDPENVWLSHATRRRLTAEELRDSLLAVSGTLDLSPGEAHPFPPEATWTFTQHNPFNAVYDTSRRSVYLMVQRQRRHPYLALFDGADPNSSTAGRQATTVPTQALYFLNDPFFHQQAATLAGKIPQGNEADRLRWLFLRLFQRVPTDEETALAGPFLSRYPGTLAEQWAAYARVLLASNEFLYVD